jgi:hypothetical protein
MFFIVMQGVIEEADEKGVVVPVWSATTVVSVEPLPLEQPVVVSEPKPTANTVVPAACAA